MHDWKVERSQSILRRTKAQRRSASVYRRPKQRACSENGDGGFLFHAGGRKKQIACRDRERGSLETSPLYSLPSFSCPVRAHTATCSRVAVVSCASGLRVFGTALTVDMENRCKVTTREEKEQCEKYALQSARECPVLLPAAQHGYS